MSSSYYHDMSKRSKDDRALIKEQNNKIEKLNRLSNPLDTIEFRQYLRVRTSRILFFSSYKNEIGYVVANPNVKLYQLVEEPNGRDLTLQQRYLRLSGTDVKDYSGFNNHGYVWQGNPTRSTAHTDYQSACVFDGEKTTLRVPHSDSISITGLNVGFYVSAWINPTRLDLHGGEPRVIACKVDDDPNIPERGWSLWLMPNGTLMFAVMMGGVSFARAATGAITSTNTWYQIGAGFNISGSTIPPLVVNTQSFVNDAQIFTGNVPPHLPPASAGAGLDLLVGSCGDEKSSYYAGKIADFRFWKNRLLTTTEHSNYYANRHSVSPVTHVAMVGVTTLAYGTEGGVGGIPPPAPPPLATFSYSPVSFSPKSFTVNRNTTGDNAPGGGGGSSSLIPDQFIEDFQDATYTLSSVDQLSPNLRWKLLIVPGGTGTNAGFVRVEDYTHPGLATTRLLRMRRGDSPGPTIATNGAQFTNVWMRCKVRTLQQLAAGDNNYARIMFKYVGENDHYSVLIRPTGARLLKTQGAATSQTVLAEESNPAGNVLHPVGTTRNVIVESLYDGTAIFVNIDGQLVISYSTGTPQDTIITSQTPIVLRAAGCEATYDDILVRPVFSDSFQGLTYTLTTVGSKSINQQWELIRAAGTGGTVRTYDDGTFENGGRVFNINTGTAQPEIEPVVLSTASYKSVNWVVKMATKSRHVAGNANSAHFIMKWKDANNYYAFRYFETGWEVIRRLNGTLNVIASGTGMSLPLNTFHVFKGYITNSGKTVRLYIGNTLIYSDDVGQLSSTDAGGTDGGLLGDSGRIGFTAVKCNAVWDNLAARASTGG